MTRLPHWIGRALCLLSIVATAPIAIAADLAGRVVSVHDGDTLTLLVERRQVKVRLTEIDAPELRQPFGTRSRQALAEVCAGKAAQVDDRGKDRYGRTLGRGSCAGVDANAEQVRRGMAWVYDRYVTDRGLYTLQNDARAARRGLWADPRAMPPWEWRRTKVGN